MSRLLLSLVTLYGACLLGACEKPPPPPPPPPAAPVETPALRYFGRPADGKLHVYFLDVDQGDATLIVSPDGHTVLIDAGPASAGTHLANRLPELLADKLDLVVLTHPHADHYGGLAAAVGAVGARRLLEPQLPNTPADYDALLASLAARGVEVLSPEPPSATERLRLPLGGDAELTVLWPRAPTERLLAGEGAAELNSIVLRLTYRDTSLLLMGDAREQTERLLLDTQAPLQATLLKVGAHGAGMSTSAPFLEAVHPRVALMSTGAGNPESAPSRDVLARLEAQKTRLFRTDRDGEVRAVSDGQRFILTAQRRTPENPTGAAESYLGRVEPLGPPKALATPAVAAGTDTQPARKPTTHLELDESAPAPKTRPARAERPDAAADKGAFVASRNSDRRYFHRPECFAARRISDKNKVRFRSREEAQSKNFNAHTCVH